MNVINLTILGIILANVLFSKKGFDDYSFFEKYKFNIKSIQRGEYLRFITSGFLHADWTHLIFNMLSLYFFAELVILKMGVLQFLFLYGFSLFLGNFLSFVLYRKNMYYSAVGASGAVTGVIYAGILFYPSMTIYVFFIPMPSLVFGVLYLLYSIYGMKSQNSNIGHSAHIGGAIAGYGYVLVRNPYMLQTQPWVVLILTIPVVVLLVMFLLKKI